MAFVGNHHRELASQERRGLRAALPIEVHRDFAVALGGEVIAARSKTLAKLAVTVELAVHHNVHRAIRACHGLAAVSQTDDRQTCVSEGPLAVTRRPDAGAVRSAMLQEFERRIAPVSRKPAPCHRGEYSAHALSSDIVVARDSRSTMPRPNPRRCLSGQTPGFRPPFPSPD